ncbi:MAG: 4Fe-4S dicluster domain-containing protein, partial [Gammaproteobacteria bacterium]|nr:4Fe-4S dicluster domain-containing protein [Gammaproteobacteria bacterium]
QRIRHKYRLKNTTGYGVNALLDFEDPIDQVLHLAVGSEGTLCFIESVVLESVRLKPLRAASLLCFSDVFTAADAVPVLKALNVSAVELLDWTSLRTMIGKSGTPEWLSELKSGNAALLVEVSADAPDILQSLYTPIIAAQFRGLVRPIVFETDSEQITALWQIRSGIFPVVGSKRPKGSMVIIEDVAVPVDKLGSFVNELRGLFERYEFHSAVIFGHARDGNLHFIVTPNLSVAAERDRFKHMMESLVALVVDRFDGSLKAEHGTGRAMAPFVEREWGGEIYDVMTRIKRLFDPYGILNPDVIINPNTEAHIQQLKDLPNCNDEMDLCIECGFCESACPTTPFNYSPRQRIAAHRLSQLGEPVDLDAVASSCVACGHCEEACPVGINTSRALNASESAARSRMSRKVLSWQRQHWGVYLELSRRAIAIYRMIGRYRAGQRWLAWLNRQFPKRVPKWIPAKIEHPGVSSLGASQYLLLTNCADRILNDSALAATIQRLALSVDVRVGVLDEHFCCGQRFDHLGETALAKLQRDQFQSLPNDTVVIAEATSCLSTLLRGSGQRVIGLAEFVTTHILPKLNITRVSERVEVHLGCTLKSANERQHVTALLDQLLDDWSFTSLACCGGQGEVQFFDETVSANLIASSELSKSRSMVIGMNTSCESALARQLRRPVMSLATLIDQCAN